MMRSIEFGGGLGDVFKDIFHSDMYTQLECIPEGERVQIVLRSANPGLHDLFRWHPLYSQMDIVDIGAGDPWGPEQREIFGIGEPLPKEPRNEKELNFYPSKDDLELLSGISHPYVVFAISAGWPSVNIPLPIAEEAVDVAIKMGMKVVSVGRSYMNVMKNFTDGSHDIGAREELRLKERDGVIDTIDRLSVPGVAVLVKNSAATFCCHSSLKSISWSFKKPMFCVYHEMKQREWTEKAGTTWGRDFEGTEGICMNDWHPEKFERFLEKIRSNGSE
jgi:ADP-heptose:LPS heptosyltransferase